MPSATVANTTDWWLCCYKESDFSRKMKNGVSHYLSAAESAFLVCFEVLLWQYLHHTKNSPQSDYEPKKDGGGTTRDRE